MSTASDTKRRAHGVADICVNEWAKAYAPAIPRAAIERLRAGVRAACEVSATTRGTVEAPDPPLGRAPEHAADGAADTFDAYQSASGARTGNLRDEHLPLPPAAVAQHLAVLCLGIAGEAGECCELVKKHLDMGHPLDLTRFVLELGDVLWYVAMAARTIGVSLSAVASANVDKLLRRYPSGWTHADSLQRRDRG